MIELVADENITALDCLPRDQIAVRTVRGRELTPQQILGADALWVRSVTQVDAVLLGDTSLRFIGTATAGTEHIDQDLLKARRIGFAAAPGSNANSVVEYVIAALIELQTPWKLLESGGTLGIVGCGEVGKRLRDFARVMGWKLRIFDPWVQQALHDSDVGLSSEPNPQFHSLDDVLACDVISLHCSLHKHEPWPSFHLIDEAALAKLRQTQWLINAARGPVVDNQALLRHLRTDTPANYVLDVWEGEPDIDTKLLACPNLRLATPHIAGYSVDAKRRATGMLYEAMRSRGLVQGTIDTRNHNASPLRRTPAESALDAVRGLMSQRYRIHEDDRRLRVALGESNTERGMAFDALRRDYPPRCELRGSVFEAGTSEGRNNRYAVGGANAARLIMALGLGPQ